MYAIIYYILHIYDVFLWPKKKKPRKSVIESNLITSQKGKLRPRRGKGLAQGHTTILGTKLLGSRSPGPDLSPQWPGDGGAPWAGSEEGAGWKGEPGWGLVGSTSLPPLASAPQERPLSGPH